MSMAKDYLEVEPSRESVDQLAGPVLVEFGTAWCGFCRTAQPLLEKAMSSHPSVQHLKIEDGPGRRLGRSFKIKLWPTLVFLRDGSEVARLVRPGSIDEIRDALAQIDNAG